MKHTSIDADYDVMLDLHLYHARWLVCVTHHVACPRRVPTLEDTLVLLGRFLWALIAKLT